jgi:hypothetical protein
MSLPAPRPASLRRMNARLKTLALLVATVATLMALTVGPAMATEEAPADEGSGKITFPETPRDQVGLVILGVTALAALAALGNAAKQLRGERPQADGRIRWR